MIRRLSVVDVSDHFAWVSGVGSDESFERVSMVRSDCGSFVFYFDACCIPRRGRGERTAGVEGAPKPYKYRGANTNLSGGARSCIGILPRNSGEDLAPLMVESNEFHITFRIIFVESSATVYEFCQDWRNDSQCFWKSESSCY